MSLSVVLKFMQIKNLIFPAMFVFALLVLPNDALACMYGPPYATVCEKYANASAIVTATVKSVEPNSFGQSVGLDIERSHKGNFSGKFVLEQPLGTCDWDFSSEVGRKLLLYLRNNEGRSSFHAIGTGYGGRVEHNFDDIYWLEGLPRSLNRNRVSGTLAIYKRQPFEFIRGAAGVKVTLSRGEKRLQTSTDENGVFQFWDVPAAKYTVSAAFGDSFKLRFALSKGNVEFKPITRDRVDTQVFSIVIGKEKCGGSDYVLNNIHE